MDEDLRILMGISIKGSIIVMDEAHNIENSAEDCCSKKIAEEDLIFTMNHISNLKEPL